jgi:hypothetical protein
MKLSLVQNLISEGLIDEAELAECEEIERETGQPLDRILQSKGFVTEAHLIQLLSRTLRIRSVGTSTRSRCRREFVQRVPGSSRAITTSWDRPRERRFRDRHLEPLDIHPMDEVASMLGQRCPSSPCERRSRRSSARPTGARRPTSSLDGIEEDDMISLTKVIDESKDVLDIANKPPIIADEHDLFEALRSGERHPPPAVRRPPAGPVPDRQHPLCSKVIPKKFRTRHQPRQVMGRWTSPSSSAGRPHDGQGRGQRVDVRI